MESFGYFLYSEGKDGRPTFIIRDKVKLREMVWFCELKMDHWFELYSQDSYKS